MKTKEQRYNELYSSGLVSSIKNLFGNRSDISEDYYVLMADYIDSMDEIKDEMQPGRVRGASNTTIKPRFTTK